MPAISHVAVTVTDLSASEAWYTRVFGVGPVLDEDTGPFRHIVYQLGNTLFGLHGFPDLHSKDQFDERTPAWTTSRSAAPAAPNSWSGPPAWTSWAWPTARS
jgi:catechol 2,3-dioxygenase-like lactoylglutathione lyase family enzyme